MTLISKHQPNRILINVHVTNEKADRAVTMFERKSCGFYCAYKQRHKDEYQSDISHPYKYQDSKSSLHILYDLLPRGHTSLYNLREIRW